MIETPSIFTPIHEEEVIQDNKLESFSEEFYKKVALNNNWALDLRPVGTIIFVNINQEGGGIPDLTIYQECNGSEITNPNSPLRSIGINQNFVPNFSDRYLRFSDDLNTNPEGGSQEHNLMHNHATGFPNTQGGAMGDKGSRRYRIPHTHSVAQQYVDPTVIDSPAFVGYIAYIKVV